MPTMRIDGEYIQRIATRVPNSGPAISDCTTTGNGKYTVCPDSENPHCTCLDHETRGVKCKHIFAVEFVGSDAFCFCRPA